MASLISRIETGHRDMIHDAQMDYYGMKLATCSSDRTVKIFDVKPDGQQILSAELLGHDGPVWQLSWSHPMHGSLLASCSYDRKVIIWRQNVGKWSKFYEYMNHDASINSIAWSPCEYGLMLACASSDGSLSILYWTGDSWESKKILNAHGTGCNAVSWCPDSITSSSVADDNAANASKPPTLATGGQKRLVSGGCDNLVKIWKETTDGQWVEEKRLEGHKDWVRDVAWAPNVGALSSKHTIASCSQDQRVIIWKCQDLEQTKTPHWTSDILHTFEDAVWHVSWSLCGNLLAVSAGDNKISLWKENLEGEWIRLTDSPKNLPLNNINNSSSIQGGQTNRNNNHSSDYSRG